MGLACLSVLGLWVLMQVLPNHELVKCKVIICNIPNAPLLENHFPVLLNRTLIFMVVARPRNGVGALIPQVCALVTICCSWSGLLHEELEHRIYFGLCSVPSRADICENLRMLLCVFFPDSWIFLFHRM